MTATAELGSTLIEEPAAGRVGVVAEVSANAVPVLSIGPTSAVAVRAAAARALRMCAPFGVARGDRTGSVLVAPTPPRHDPRLITPARLLHTDRRLIRHLHAEQGPVGAVGSRLH